MPITPSVGGNSAVLSDSRSLFVKPQRPKPCDPDTSKYLV